MDPQQTPPKPEAMATPGDPVAGPDHDVLMRMPVDVRNMALGVIAVLAVVVILKWAAEVFVPVMIGVMLSYALSPLVDRMARWRIPRAVGASLVMATLIGALAFTGWSLSDDAAAMLDRVPDTARKLRDTLRKPQAMPQTGALKKVEQAAAEIEQVAKQAAQPAVKPAPPPRGVMRVQIEKPPFSIRDHLWSGTLGLATLVGQTLIVALIAFFMLASGDTFRRKLVKIAGPTFTKKKITVQMLDEITAQVQRYLLVNVFTSAVVGVATWLAFLWIGLDQAAVWGILAGVLNLMPYIGAITVTGGAALVGFVQFGSIEMALVVAGASFAIQAMEGYLLTPWLTSRANRMSPVVIFVGVLLFGWLWGVWGLLLGPPILMSVKAVCERIDDLKPIGELLGD